VSDLPYRDCDMRRVDLKKERKELYAPRRDPVLVDVPPMPFLAVDGAGDPNGPDFAAAVQALFAVSYLVKFALKREAEVDHAVMPLEGLWWADDHAAFAAEDREAWRWTAMIAQPKVADRALIDRATHEAGAKKDLPALPGLRFELFEEGRSAQVMHLGPFSKEGPTIARLEEFIEEQGLTRNGKHHEIYLSDLRRTAPERLRTVIRQPVA
jgi:hypothetical protein